MINDLLKLKVHSYPVGDPFAYRDLLLQLREQLGIKHYRVSQGTEPGVHTAIGDRGNLYFDSDEQTIWILLKSRSAL